MMHEAPKQWPLAIAACALSCCHVLNGADACKVTGEVFSGDPFDNSLRIKADNASDMQTVPFAKATEFSRVTTGHAPAGSFDPKNIQAGDRVCVQFGPESQTSPARVLVMQRADIQAQQKRVIEAVQHNTAYGAITEVNAAKHSIELNETQAGGAPQSVTVDGSGAVEFRQFSAGAQAAADAVPGGWDRLRVGDAVYVEGKRSGDAKTMRASMIILGGVRGIAGTISAIHGPGTLDLQEVRSGMPITVEIRSDAVYRASPFLEESTADQQSNPAVPWDLHPIGLADLQKGDTITVLVKGDAENPLMGLVVVTGFGSFGAEAPPAGAPVFWMLDPMKRAPQ